MPGHHRGNVSHPEKASWAAKKHKTGKLSLQSNEQKITQLSHEMPPMD
jgi:hypothetical protein